MNESRVLRSSASPKNVSPHMNGGSAHTQVSGGKPVVRVNMNNGGVQAHNKPGNNVVLKSSAGPQRVTPRPNVGPQGATVQTGRAGAVMPPGGPKPMVHVNMANGGKPQVSTDGRPLPPGNVQLLGRNGDRRQVGAVARRPMTQPQSGGFRSIAAPAPMQQAPEVSSKQLSDEQLMLCRYVLNQYTQSEGANELTAALATKTLDDIDTLLKGGTIEAIDSTETIIENNSETFEPNGDAPAPLNISVGPAQRSGGGVRGPRRFAAARVIPPPTNFDGMGGDEPADIADGQQIIDVDPSDGSPE